MAFVAPALAAATSFIGSTAGMAALTLGTAAFTGYTAIQQGKYQAAVARNNAKYAEQNANLTSEASQREQMRSDQDYRSALGEMEAAQSASGLDILGRTQLRSRNTTRRSGRQAALDIRQEGTAGARRFLQDAANFKAEGRAAKAQGYTTAIGAGLGAAKDISSQFGWTDSLVSSRRGGRRPWNQSSRWWRNG